MTCGSGGVCPVCGNRSICKCQIWLRRQTLEGCVERLFVLSTRSFRFASRYVDGWNQENLPGTGWRAELVI